MKSDFFDNIKDGEHQKDAKETLCKIREMILSDKGGSGGGEPKTLRLVKTWSGDYQLKKQRWYHNFCFWAPFSQKEALGKIVSILEAAYPLAAPSVVSWREEFSGYLVKKGKITTDIVRKFLENAQEVSNKRSEIIEIVQMVQTSEAEKQTQEAPLKKIEPITITEGQIRQHEEIDAVKNFLEMQLSIKIESKCCGNGAYGSVYEANPVGEMSGELQKKYIFKVENNSVVLANGSELEYQDIKWWRKADIAASRLHDIRNITEVTQVVIEVEERGKKSIYVLPPAEAKNFGLNLWKTNSNAKVSMIASLMEKAPGEDLEKTLKTGTEFNCDSIAFRDLLNACLCYIEDAHGPNLIHSDIKPANIMVAPRSAATPDTPGSVKLIDLGFARRGQKRYQGLKQTIPKTHSKHPETESSNPISFTKKSGTEIYMHPSVLKNRYGIETPYKSEVDAHSFGLTLLNSLNPVLFETNWIEPMNKTLKDMKKVSKERTDAREKCIDFLQKVRTKYIETLSTKNVIDNEIKSLINLIFQYSDTGSEEDYKNLQKASHVFQEKYQYGIKTDVSKKSQLPTSSVPA